VNSLRAPREPGRRQTEGQEFRRNAARLPTQPEILQFQKHSVRLSVALFLCGEIR
jgi:hypothetical protein